MKRTVAALLATGLGFAAIGCGPQEITNADAAEMDKKYGRNAYEKAMKDAGRQKELDQQKAVEGEQPRER